MAAWGKTSDIEGGDDSLHHLPPGVGIDGTGGTQPRYTRVLGNVVREIGMNERQSSAWSEAKVRNTIPPAFYHSPRRGASRRNVVAAGSTAIKLLFSVR